MILCGKNKKSLTLFFSGISLMIFFAIYDLAKLAAARGWRKDNPEEFPKAGSNNDAKRCSRWVVADFQPNERRPKFWDTFP